MAENRERTDLSEQRQFWRVLQITASQLLAMVPPSLKSSRVQSRSSLTEVSSSALNIILIARGNRSQLLLPGGVDHWSSALGSRAVFLENSKIETEMRRHGVVRLIIVSRHDKMTQK